MDRYKHMKSLSTHDQISKTSPEIDDKLFSGFSDAWVSDRGIEGWWSELLAH